MRARAFGLCMVALLVFSTAARGAELKKTSGDWPQWRGPARDGISPETGLLKKWPTGGPPLLWQAKGLGSGYASVSVVGGRIYTTGKRDQGECLIALSAEDGHLLWATPFGTGDHSNSTPAVDGPLVYAVALSGDLVCADAAAGKIRWQKNYERDFGGHMMSSWGFSESPLVDGDRLICTPGGDDAVLAALDKGTGKVIWRAAMPSKVGPAGNDGAAYSSIVVSEGAGVRQYVQLVGRGIVSVRASDGKVLWTYNRIANGTANIPTPVVHGDYVFCSSGYGTGAALLKLVRDGDGVKVEEQYFLNPDKMQNHHGGMVMVGDYLYCGSGHNQGFPLCLEWKTGKAAWGPRRGPGSDSAAVLYADGQLYFRYQDGTMALIDARPDQYKVISTFKIASHLAESWPHPVIAGGRLYLRDQDVLLCYDIQQH